MIIDTDRVREIRKGITELNCVERIEVTHSYTEHGYEGSTGLNFKCFNHRGEEISISRETQVALKNATVRYLQEKWTSQVVQGAITILKESLEEFASALKSAMASAIQYNEAAQSVTEYMAYVDAEEGNDEGKD